MAPPPTTAPTILSLKQTFLTTQTRLLSQPPEPSRAWRRGNNSHHPSSQGGDDEEGRNHQKLSEKALNDALYRLNHTLQQHARRVYAPQATRHVAEQIDQLYLGVGERRRRGGDENGDGEGGDEDEVEGEGDAWKMVGADYANPTIISTLPPTWDSPDEATAHPLEAKRYAELTTRLQDLSARKSQVEARVLRLRKIKSLLAPFSTTNDEEGDAEMTGAGSLVQENLVTRDGEVEKELERMRMLLVRVADKVARLREREREGRAGGGGEEEEEDDELFGEGEAMVVDDVEVVERRKVERLLDGMR